MGGCIIIHIDEKHMKKQCFPIIETLYKFYIEEFHIEGHVCPHCGIAHKIGRDDVEIHGNYSSLFRNEIFALVKCDNPGCEKTAVYMEEYECMDTSTYTEDYMEIVTHMDLFKLIDRKIIYPVQENKLLYAYNEEIGYIPEMIMNDFIEAQRLLSVSPNASIVFARKTLERILLGYWPDIIEAPHKEGELPSLAAMIKWLDDNKKYDDAETLGYIKDIGNCAIHIMNPQEEIRYSYNHAVLALGVIDTLLDTLFIAPRKKEDRRNNLKGLAAKSKIEKKSQIQKTLSGN